MQYRYLKGTDHKYAAGDDGNIYRVKEEGKKLERLHNDISTGYARVRINGKRHQVHTLIAESFVSKDYPGLNVVAHKDGNTLNNKPENLYWTSMSDLSRHE